MATFTRRAAVGALVLIGLFATHGVASAQFAYGWTRYGYNPNNPFVAQQQYIANLQANALAIRAGAQVPASLPYLAPYVAPAIYPPYVNTGYGGYGYTAPLVNSYVNPYSAVGNYYNPYVSPYSFTSPYLSNVYSGYGY